MSDDIEVTIRLTADDGAELRRAYEIVRDGRRYTLEHFGPATEHAYVGRFTARAYEDAIDQLVATLGDALGGAS